MKQCAKCKIAKPIESFGKFRQTKDGLHVYCKECIRIINKARYNKKDAVARSVAWARANRERKRAINHKWLTENREKHSTSTKRWTAENKERHKAVSERWIAGNKKRHIAIHAKANAKRRALKYGVEVDPTVSLNCAYERFHGLCGICNHKVVRKDATLDHIYPLSKGGAHIWDNIQLAHRACNSLKGVRVAVA